MTKSASFWHHYWRQILTAHHLRIVRYGIVGLTNMSVCFMIMYLGALVGLHYLQYTILGYSVAIIYSFYMNLRFTFRVSGNISTRLFLFFLINFTNLGLVEVIEYVMIDVWRINHFFSIICAMVWYSLAGFICNMLFVYRNKK
jgi:putative flippase GtrA